MKVKDEYLIPCGSHVAVKPGTKYYTPRFCWVTVRKVYTEESVARADGFTEESYRKDAEFRILGKNIGNNRMYFAAVLKDGASAQVVPFEREAFPEEVSVRKEVRYGL